MLVERLERLGAFLKRYRRVRRVLRLWVRRHRARTTGYPDWPAIITPRRVEWDRARAAAAGGPRILIATSVGAFLPGTSVESLLAAALTLRGAEVHALLCDAALPACFDCDHVWYPDPQRFLDGGPARDLCATCFTPAAAMFDALGIHVHRYRELLLPEDHAQANVARTLPLADLGSYRWQGLAVGEHAWAGALRFLARATLDGEPHGEAVVRRYLEAAILSAGATRRLLGREHFASAVVNHGIYVPQGITGEVARAEGVRVAAWSASYRQRCFIFSHDDTYHHTLMNEPVAKWEAIDWNDQLDARLTDYLRSRWYGTQDWIWVHDRPEVDVRRIAREVGADFSRPSIGLLTNVMWDAQVHYPANAFPSMLDWVLRTIAYFGRRGDLQLIIRIHPAEAAAGLPSRQPVLGEIAKAFPTLPPNVFVIPPQSRVSTYAAMELCNAAIIYGTKTGVELAATGIPVIVAGEAWVRGKGITTDASSAEEYFRILDRLPFASRLDPATVRRARKYAYHFFFRRMIPLEHTEPRAGWPPFRLRLDHLEDLRPGRSAGLDVVCAGILDGRDFIFPAERLLPPRAAPPPSAGHRYPPEPEATVVIDGGGPNARPGRRGQPCG
jgi:hypothetical protein